MADEERQLILSPQPSDRKQLMASHLLRLALRSEHSTNEGLLAEREYLLQLIELRNEQWTRHMKAQQVKMDKYNATKLEVLVDTKERKASSYKEYAELVETDLEDAYTCIAALGAEIKALKSKLSNAEALRPIGAYDSTELKDLKLEIRKLKHGYKTLKSEKEAQLSEKENQIDALVCEKDFVWNQFKVMESEYVAALKSKNSELDKSNEAITMLKKNLEEMEASILEKDSTISKMKEEMSASISEKDGTISQLKQKFQASISKKDDMISRLNGEVENLKKMLKEKDQMISGLHADVAKFAARVGPPLCKPVDSGTSRTLRSGTKRTRESVSWAQPSASQSVSGQRQHSNRSQGSASASTAETPRGCFLKSYGAHVKVHGSAYSVKRSACFFVQHVVWPFLR
ncbi:hypothetical protein FCM35_KLT04614 [Carex littledalei]|uniref:Uncharacterized protein n=1 Tax=Carex littledalei TaxID=544730 RepID=A0A833VLE8_9POAL|nr:hypothetical protein FCM35_KLT04614 [Carex littledalei]